MRPWKLLRKDTISCFAPEGSMERPTFRANLRAASFASLPLLEMKTWDRWDVPGEADWVAEIKSLLSAGVHGLW